MFSLQKSPVLQLGSQLKPKLAWTWTPLGVPPCSSPQQPPCPSHHPAVTLHTGRQRMSELVVFWEKKRVNRTATTHQNCARDCLGPPTSRAANTSGQNHRMVWVGRDLTDHLVPTPCHEQGHLPPAQGAQSSIQPGLEHFPSPAPPKPGSLTLCTRRWAFRLSAAAGAALPCGTRRGAHASRRPGSSSPGQQLPHRPSGSEQGPGSARHTWKLDPATPRTNQATASLRGEGPSDVCGALAGPRTQRATPG